MYGFVFLGRERTFRRRSIAALDLEAGDSVLELGCGPGNSLAPLRQAVGAEGRVVAVDYSDGMVDQAAGRVAAAGWENVDVIRGEATRPGVAAESFDAAYAAMSLSAMDDPAAAVEAAAASLGPAGRLAVLDARPFQRLPLSLSNPIVKPAFRALTDWRPEIDVPAAMDSAFEKATVEEYHLGSIYVARGERPTVTDR
nr:methyltransferase domain-containing protein [Halovenus carboxidivorans]